MSDAFVRGKGPVVLCFVDAEPTLPGAARALLEPLSEEAAYFAAGTGLDRLDVAAATRAFADKPLPMVGTQLQTLIERARSRDTYTDFFTDKVKSTCSMHLFVDIAEGGASVKALEAVLDMVVPYEPSLSVHAFLAGPGRTAFAAFSAIENRLGPRGALDTVAGASYTLGPAADWDRVLEAYRAIVMLFEGEPFFRAEEALTQHYGLDRDDIDIPPVRIGEFGGLRGELQSEWGAPSGTTGEGPHWEWRGQDVGMIVSTRGDQLDRLLRILTRTELPQEVADMVTTRGRWVVPFDRESLLTLVPTRGSSLPSLLSTTSTTDGLLGALAAAEKRTLRVFDAAHAGLATFSFDGDRNAATTLDGEASAAAAVEKATQAISEGALDFVMVAAEQAPLDDLVRAVEARAGALLVVSPASVTLVAKGLGEGALSAGAFRDLFATVLDLAAVSVSSSGARSLVAR